VAGSLACEHEREHAGVCHYCDCGREGVDGVQSAKDGAIALTGRGVVGSCGGGCAGKDWGDGAGRYGEKGMHDGEEEGVELAEDEVELLRRGACG